MKLRLAFTGTADQTMLREFAEKHLYVALEKFAHRIASVRVTLRDENATNRGDDKYCRIDVKLKRHGFVTTSHTGDELHASFMTNLHKVERAVAKHIRRHIYGRNVRHTAGRVTVQPAVAD